MAKMEIKGSRREWQDGKFKYGERLWVGESESDVSADGAFFKTGSGATAETGLSGRILVSKSVTQEVLPGLVYIQETYRAFKPFA